MPVIHKYKHRTGHYVKGFVPSAKGYSTWQVMESGERLVREWGLVDGQQIPDHLFWELHHGGHLFTEQGGVTPVVEQAKGCLGLFLLCLGLAAAGAVTVQWFETKVAFGPSAWIHLARGSQQPHGV